MFSRTSKKLNNILLLFVLLLFFGGLFLLFPSPADALTCPTWAYTEDGYTRTGSETCYDFSYGGSCSDIACKGERFNVSYTACKSVSAGGGCAAPSVTVEYYTDDSCNLCPSGQTCSGGACVPICASHSSSSCYDNDVYWYNSCGTREEKKQECYSERAGWSPEYRCSGDWQQRNYRYVGCSGSSCYDYYSFVNWDWCGDCSCSCGGFSTTESLANGNCSDGKDNDCDGKSDSADPACVLPTCASPSNISYGLVTANSIEIQWQAVSGATQYRLEWISTIQYADPACTRWGVCTLTTSNTSATVRYLQSSTEYQFRVQVAVSNGSCAVPSSWTYSSKQTKFCEGKTATPSFSGPIPIGAACSVTITPKATDLTDGGGLYETAAASYGTAGYIQTIFDDGTLESTDCDLDLEFKNSWSVSGDQITVKTEFVGYDARHDLQAGYTIAAQNCSLATYGTSRTVLDNVQVINGSVTKNLGSQTYEIDYCGDGEITEGEVCEPPSALADSCGIDTLKVDQTCKTDCTGYSATTYTCSAVSACQSRSCGGQSYSCTYDNGDWQWREAIPAENCTDGEDNDCDTLIDGADVIDCDTIPPTTDITIIRQTTDVTSMADKGLKAGSYTIQFRDNDSESGLKNCRFTIILYKEGKGLSTIEDFGRDCGVYDYPITAGKDAPTFKEEMEDGIYIVYSYATDNANNDSETTFDILPFDFTAPTIE